MCRLRRSIHFLVNFNNLYCFLFSMRLLISSSVLRFIYWPACYFTLHSVIKYFQTFKISECDQFRKIYIKKNPKVLLKCTKISQYSQDYLYLFLFCFPFLITDPDQKWSRHPVPAKPGFLQHCAEAERENSWWSRWRSTNSVVH